MNQFKLKAIFSALALSSLTGCLVTPQAYNNPQLAQARAALTQRMMAPQVQNQNQMAQQEPAISEQELLAKKENVFATGGPALFELKKDGILIDGEMYLDFEGSVAKHGSNRLTGEFTYAIQNFDGTFTLKYFRAGSTAEPIKIATVFKNGSSYNVRTVTGKTLPGSTLIPTADGFIIGRTGSAFQYTIGGRVKPLNLVDGYHIAQFQKGDVASSGYILLEKDSNPAQKSGIGGLMDSIDSLGNTLGLNKADHYVLANIATGETVPLDVHLSGKDVAEYSGCVQRNSVVNECANVNFTEALFDQNGFKNGSHYFWAIDWASTPTGPIAFYKTSTKVKAVDIKNGQVHTLFTRALGVNEYHLARHADGKISVIAKLGFSSDTIDDVVSYIRNESQDIEPMQVLGE
ncbi:hypothetical protein [Thalassotalea mangrovi]|uniref:Lipoprotein n=1 Tax=Thalassotalea mangrovi TaxID=2572245 RepID=A0A4U1B6P3_9GAMM|nr:hypothetical protein [Thalassotalea mangrovi]TKB46128.1 hypothetical protein E8M12_05740 [Thalassotalea mangrovi]